MSDDPKSQPEAEPTTCQPAQSTDGVTMLTAERLREVLSYDPDTGVFLWIAKTAPRGNRRAVGEKAGRLGVNGYFSIGIDRRRYLSHRLAWLYMTGEWPSQQIDHIDGVRANNCWANLRLASPAENGRNRGAQTNSRSGVKGVHEYAPGRWRARIRRIDLGVFGSIDEAEAAYRAAEARMFGEFVRAR